MSSTQDPDLTKSGKIKRNNSSLLLDVTPAEEKARRLHDIIPYDKEFKTKLKCTKCLSSYVRKGRDCTLHPVLKVPYCKSCLEFYTDGDFSVDEDEEDKYCRWCGEGGKLFICAQCICGFCPNCIKRNLGKTFLKTVEEDDDWLCLICNPEPLWELRHVAEVAVETYNIKSSTTVPETSSGKKGRERKVQTTSESEEAENNEEKSTVDKKQSPRSKKSTIEETKSSEVEKKDSPEVPEEGVVLKPEVKSIVKLLKFVKMTSQVCMRTTEKLLKCARGIDNDEGYSQLVKKMKRFNTVLDLNERMVIKAKGRTQKFQAGCSVDDAASLNDSFAMDIAECAPLLNDSVTTEDPGLDNDEGVPSGLEKVLNDMEKELKSNTGSNSPILHADEAVSSTDINASSTVLCANNDGNDDSTIDPNKVTNGIDIVACPTNSNDANTTVGPDNERNDDDIVECSINETDPVVCHKNDSNVVSNNVEEEIDNIVSPANGGNDTVENGNGSTKSHNQNCEASDEIRLKNSSTSKPEDSTSFKCNGDLSADAPDVEVLNDGDVQVTGDNSDVIFVQSRKSDPIVVSLTDDGNLPKKENSVKNDEDDYVKSTDNDSDDKRKERKKEPRKSRDSSLKALKKNVLLSSSDSDGGDAKDDSSDDLRSSPRVRRTPRKKLSERQKRLRKRRGNVDEETEVKRLTDLKSLRRRIKSRIEDSEDSEVSDQNEQKERNEKTPKKEKAKGKKKEGSKLFDMMRELLSDSESGHSASSAKSNDSYVNFYEKNKKLLKDVVLGTSSDECHDSNNEEQKASDGEQMRQLSSTPIQTNKRMKGTSSEDESKKKKRTSRLISESDSESEIKKKRKRSSSESEIQEIEVKETNVAKKKRRIRVASDSDESSSDNITKKDRSWKRIANLSSESGSDMDVEVITQKSPAKGRKNITKIMKKEQLQVETIVAVKDEEKRRARLAERAKEFKKLFGDDNKQMILDFNEKGEVVVSVSPRLVKQLKPHQVDGVKFMWDNCFESLSTMQSSNGGGCILAHCMGLGKTLQVIALVHTVLTSDIGVSTVLIVCPLNTVANWVHEFEMWLKLAKCETVDIYDINKYKKLIERRYQLKAWHEEGGVMILSYEMYRNLTNKNRKGIIETTLIRPGPDIVVCDEGHLLKNEASMLSKCMSQIQTARRIVLTGTPLQNNLKEYHCMVQFVKPNILGTIKEFMNRFVNPIENGQFEDSTENDVKVMKRRSHVLHNMLEGCIQRRDYTVLTPFLPEKHEYVISIKMADEMATLYRYYIDNLSARASGTKTTSSLFYDYNSLQRIWTHPITMQAQFENDLINKAKKDEEEIIDDFIDDRSDSSASSVKSSSSSKSSSSCMSIKSVASAKKTKKKRAIRTRNNKGSESEPEPQKEPEKPWWKDMVREDIVNDLSVSGKITLMFSILKECEELGDKVLVFSQSLYTLDFIEHFLNIKNEAGEAWTVGINYFRLDGSCSSERRATFCKAFNRRENKAAKLFLISTRAGGLGINLVGANRVIIFDASWNPSHDLQSIFRIYRFGQEKPCFIYRFLAEATMEEKIYERQVTKLSLAHRVVDEHQIERHYTMGNLQELYKFEPLPKENWKIPIVPKDMVLGKILKAHEDIIVSYHEHDSLLENKQEEELNEDERKAAWDDYENFESQLKRQREYEAELQKWRLQMQQQMKASGQQLLQNALMQQPPGGGVPMPQMVGNPAGMPRPQMVGNAAGMPRPQMVGNPAGMPRPQMVGNPAGVPRPQIFGNTAVAPRPQMVGNPAGVPRPGTGAANIRNQMASNPAAAAAAKAQLAVLGVNPQRPQMKLNPLATRQREVLQQHQEQLQQQYAAMHERIQLQRQLAQAQLSTLQAKKGKSAIEDMTVDQLVAFGTMKNTLPLEGETKSGYRSRLINLFGK